MERYFVNTGEEIEYRNTEADARRLAIRSLELWRERARVTGEWEEEAEHVCWGRLQQVAILLPASHDGSVDIVLSDKLPE